MILTSIDRIANSICGAGCGWILSNPKIFNPLDNLLVYASDYFPLDYVIFSLLIIYIFFATLAGITLIGIRFIWIHMFRFAHRATPPQGLLFGTAIIMLSILALIMEFVVIAPKYISFGRSKYFLNDTLVDCTVEAVPGNCTMTQIATFVNRILLKSSFFGIVFYWATWVFIGAYFVGLIIALIQSRRSNAEGADSDSDLDQ